MALFIEHGKPPRKLSRAEINDLCCPICGKLDLRLISGQHRCRQKALDNIDHKRKRLEVQDEQQAEPKQPDKIEQLNNGLKQYEQQENT